MKNWNEVDKIIDALAIKAKNDKAIEEKLWTDYINDWLKGCLVNKYFGKHIDLFTNDEKQELNDIAQDFYFEYKRLIKIYISHKCKFSSFCYLSLKQNFEAYRNKYSALCLSKYVGHKYKSDALFGKICPTKR